jgi:hypothetical protein
MRPAWRRWHVQKVLARRGNTERSHYA